MSTFPQARKLGYDTAQVDDFLDLARRAYDSDGTGQDGAPLLTSADIRHTSFSMRRHGYSSRHVDAALERLEDAFALRERERAEQQRGQEAWFADARASAKEIAARLGRGDKHRFARTSILSVGYNVADVDRFSRRMLRYFKEGRAMAVDDVRTVVFRRQHGGYREVQVDLLLDAVTDVMLAVR